MMKFRKLIAYLLLLGWSVFRVDAYAASEPGYEAKMADVRKLGKRNIQVVVREDGRVVERLVLPNAVKQADIPANPEAWLQRMMDPTKNGVVVKHPELFAEWLDAVTEPRFMTALASIAMAPETVTNSLGKMADPATARNWGEFADPQILLRWMATGVDPRFYQGLFNRLTDAEKMRRWGLYPAFHDKPTSSGERLMVAKQPDVWLQLPARDSRSNPWLINNLNYRY